MLRVGLTGGLASGKSTVARMFAALGAHVLSSDEIGRSMMQPGEAVFAAIVDHFGQQVLTSTGAMDRARLAHLSFVEDRIAELTAIVHPAVIARQAELTMEIAQRTPNAVVITESALLFETEHAGAEGWRARFDRILLVMSRPDDQIRRFVDRTAGASEVIPQTRETDARGRLARQMTDADKSRWADFIFRNEGSLDELERQVQHLWPRLLREAQIGRNAPQTF